MNRLVRIIILPCFVICVALSSCVTYKRCSDKFQWKSDTIKTIVYRDTTIQVLIHGTDTVFATAYIQDTLYFSSGTAHSIVYIKHDTINQQLWSTDTTLIVKLDSVIREKTIVNKQVVVVTKKAKIATTLWQIFAIIIGILFIFIVRLFKKK